MCVLKDNREAHLGALGPRSPRSGTITPMLVLILCGGRGSRLGSSTDQLPKPLVRIGDQPILWHVMNLYAAAGHHDFVLCLGHRGDAIRRFVSARGSVVQADNECVEVGTPDGWRIHLLQTGLNTMTGGRLRRAICHVEAETVLATYADGVGDVDIDALVTSHRDANRLATVTVVHPPPRFGVAQVSGDRVTGFDEKPRDDSWINGGFFVFHRKVVDLIDGDHIVLESQPLRTLALSGQLTAFPHHGFWQCMDTAADVEALRALCSVGDPPWQRACPRSVEES